MLKKRYFYPWFKDLYYKILSLKKISKYSFNLIISYSTDLGVDDFVFFLSKWFLCSEKINNNYCNKCFNCRLLINNNNPNYYEIINKSKLGISVDYIKEIKRNLFLNYFSNYKIIYFSNTNFFTYHAFNSLLKIMEEHENNFIFIFSCFDYIKIPSTILSRSFFFKLKCPLEKENYFWLNKRLNKNYNKNSIITSIRLCNNSPLLSLFILNKLWNFRISLLENIYNYFFSNVKYIINLLKTDLIKYYLNWIFYIFIDIIRLFYFDKNKIFYNLDYVDIVLYLKKKIKLKKVYLILNKLIIFSNEIIDNSLNKNILIFTFVSSIYNYIYV